MQRHLLTGFLLALSLQIIAADGDTSTLWGVDGDLYQPGGRLMDWSDSGYQQNDVAIPTTYANIKNLKTDFNAVGDGVADDTAAFKAALSYCSSVEKSGGCVINIPDGTYKVTDRLDIKSRRTILRGESRQGTIIYIPINLDDLDNNFKRSKYSWDDGFIRFMGKTDTSKSTKYQLATVTANAVFGDTGVFVNSTNGISPGAYVKLYMSNPSDNSLAQHLYNNQATALCIKRDFCLDGLDGDTDMVALAFKVKSVDSGTKFVEFEQSLPFDINTAWKPALHKLSSSLDSGIEDLTIEFIWTEAFEHHWELGYNGIYIYQVANVWVKGVTVKNADSGIWTKASHYVLIDDVEIAVTQSRTTELKPWNGHIALGFSMQTSRSRIQNFHVDVYYLHGLTNRRSYLNVARNGGGTSLSIDFHRKHPYGNLLSNINAGTGWTHPGTDVFTNTGGSKTQGMPAASYNTYWNLKKDSGKVTIMKDAQHGPCSYGTKLNYVGDYSITDGPCDQWSVELLASVTPQDLFESQLSKFKGGRR